MAQPPLQTHKSVVRVVTQPQVIRGSQPERLISVPVSIPATPIRLPAVRPLAGTIAASMSIQLPPGAASKVYTTPTRVLPTLGHVPSAVVTTPTQIGAAGLIKPEISSPHTPTSQQLFESPPSAVAAHSGMMPVGTMYDVVYRQRASRSFGDRSKGLRHFSTKVCDKVRDKNVTTYNEVADELVAEYFENMQRTGAIQTQDQKVYDTKNIRRRVYDALNVLMAMNIIAKEKKEIRWVGLPTSAAQEVRRLQEDKNRRIDRIRAKLEQLQELLVQQVAFKSLVDRNKQLEQQYGRPASNTVIYLPYIVISTHRNTTVDCSISANKSEYMFTFDAPFEIHDDVEVLKRMGLAYGLDKSCVQPEHVNTICRYVPPLLQDYVAQLAQGRYIIHDRSGRHTRQIIDSIKQRANSLAKQPFFHTGYPSATTSYVLTDSGRHLSTVNEGLDDADVEVAMALTQVASGQFGGSSAGSRGSKQPMTGEYYRMPGRGTATSSGRPTPSSAASSSTLTSRDESITPSEELESGSTASASS